MKGSLASASLSRASLASYRRLKAHLLSNSLILLSMLPDSRFYVVISGLFLPGQEIRAGDYRTEGDDYGAGHSFGREVFYTAHRFRQ